jgi:N-acetylated-alpha-linked acidic dipeptidase
LRLNAGDLTTIEKTNRGLYQLEQRLTSEAGLPLRPWFKHLIYAPGLNSGYAAVVFPGMQDALEMNNEAQVKLQADRLAETFQRLIEGLEELRSGL